MKKTFMARTPAPGVASPELARALDEQLQAVKAYGSCPSCHEAEAHAFLARLRRLLEDMGE